MLLKISLLTWSSATAGPRKSFASSKASSVEIVETRQLACTGQHSAGGKVAKQLANRIGVVADAGLDIDIWDELRIRHERLRIA